MPDDLGTLIESIDPTAILGGADQAIVSAARVIARGGIPRTQEDILPYKGKNIQIQEELGNLISRVYFIMRDTEDAVEKFIGKTLQDGDFDGYRADDRRLALRTNSGFERLNSRVILITTLHRYLTDLQWMLKNAFNSL